MFDRWRKSGEFAAEHEEALHDARDEGWPSLAQDALVVAINPADGKVWNGGRYVVPTALLLELVHEGRLDVRGTGGETTVSVSDPTPLGNAELDEALVAVGTGLGGGKVTTLLRDVPQTDWLLGELVSDGTVTEDPHRVLGMFPVTRYRPTRLARRDELVSRLRPALTGAAVPDDRTALLLSALAGVHPKVIVERGEVNEAYRRLPQIREMLGRGEQAIRSATAAAMSHASRPL